MADPRLVFGGAARSFAAVVAAVRPDQWELPALGDWDVRSLVGHALRGVTTPAAYLHDGDDPAPEVELADAGAYLRAAVATPDLHTVVAERGRESGVALGDDPASRVATEVASALAVVEAASPDARVVTPFGTMTLADYLPTRVVEVVVHTDDLTTAIGHRDVATDEELAMVATAVLAGASGEPLAVAVRALLGRTPLPVEFNLWG